MANYRRGRINEEVTKAMCEILRTLKDPRIARGFVTITGADVTPDLKFAKIYFSFLEKLPEAEAAARRAEIKKGLQSAHGYIRRALATQLNLRITPELTFIPDTSAEYGANISRILNEISAEGAETTENAENTEIAVDDRTVGDAGPYSGEKPQE